MDQQPLLKEAYRHVMAPKGKRLLAFIIDMGILALLLVLVRDPFISWLAKTLQVTLTWTTQEELFYVERFYQGADALLGLPLLILIYLVPAFIFKNGQTVGKKIMGLILIQNSGEPPRLLNLLMRTLIGLWIATYTLSVLLYFAPFIFSIALAIANRRGKALHDIIGKTIVVEKNPILVQVVEKPLPPLEIDETDDSSNDDSNFALPLEDEKTPR